MPTLAYSEKAESKVLPGAGAAQNKIMRLLDTFLNLIQIVATATFSHSFCCEKKKWFFVLSFADVAKMKRLHCSFLF
jgi:hypothetical protein